MKYLVQFLQNKITDKMPFTEVFNIFEQMCNIAIDVDEEDDLILFEAGTFSTVQGEKRFEISLVRQMPFDEEFYQIRVDIFYPADDKNKAFSSTIWNEDIDGNFFDYIRKTDVFAYADCEQYLQININLNKT